MNTPKPSVAIIIPCFNRWAHVRDAIDSVLSQTWENTHCIVVDDASTDDSYAQLEEHYKLEPRVRITYLDRNKGQSAARNYGAAIADTDYIGFLDSDDLLVKTSVQSRMNIAIEAPAFSGIIFGDKIDESTGESLLPSKKGNGDILTLDEYIGKMSWLHTNSFVMKKSEFNFLGGFNEKLRKKEDIEFFIRALNHQSARYAAGPCCMVRDIDFQRARHDHSRIIEQGENFINAIVENETLVNNLTKSQVKTLTESDTRSVLQSLYKVKRGREFREKVREAINSGKINVDSRLLKRYAFSFFHIRPR